LRDAVSVPQIDKRKMVHVARYLHPAEQPQKTMQTERVRESMWKAKVGSVG
jgi:hypothetical protein